MTNQFQEQETFNVRSPYWANHHYRMYEASMRHMGVKAMSLMPTNKLDDIVPHHMFNLNGEGVDTWFTISELQPRLTPSPQHPPLPSTMYTNLNFIEWLVYEMAFVQYVNHCLHISFIRKQAHQHARQEQLALIESSQNRRLSFEEGKRVLKMSEHIIKDRVEVLVQGFMKNSNYKSRNTQYGTLIDVSAVRSVLRSNLSYLRQRVQLEKDVPIALMKSFATLQAWVDYDDDTLLDCLLDACKNMTQKSLCITAGNYFTQSHVLFYPVRRASDISAVMTSSEGVSLQNVLDNIKRQGKRCYGKHHLVVPLAYLDDVQTDVRRSLPTMSHSDEHKQGFDYLYGSFFKHIKQLFDNALKIGKAHKLPLMDDTLIVDVHAMQSHDTTSLPQPFVNFNTHEYYLPFYAPMHSAYLCMKFFYTIHIGVLPVSDETVKHGRKPRFEQVDGVGGV